MLVPLAIHERLFVALTSQPQSELRLTFKFLIDVPLSMNAGRLKSHFVRSSVTPYGFELL
jgi:hypothetical protein